MERRIKEIGIIQFTEFGYPTPQDAVEYEVYINGNFTKWNVRPITKGQLKYIKRLSDKKRCIYILKHFES